MKTAATRGATTTPANNSASPAKCESVKALSKSLPGLTAKQYILLAFIQGFIRHKGYSPTYEEIGKATGRSKVTIYEHIHALIKKGYVELNTVRKWRQIRVLHLPEVAHAG